MRTRLGLLWMTIGCGPTLPVPDASDATSTGGVGSTSTSGSISTGMPSSHSTAGSTTDEPAESSSNPDSSNFIETPDGAMANAECSIWKEDCPRGEKCMPWANDGGPSWNATKCTPIADDPGAPGDPCTVQGNGVSGIDDCEAHAMCWNVDAVTMMGVCVAFCIGTENNPFCEDPLAECSITGDAVLVLCLPGCDPLAQDCPGGNACLPHQGSFVCAPLAGQSQAGEACEYVNTCEIGLTCVHAELVPDCESIDCCSAFCALNDPAPPCLDGQICMPWYEAGKVPPSYENVGVCAVPA